MNSAMLLPWVALLTPLTVIGWTLGSQRGRRRRLDRWFGATLLSFAALALLDLWSPSSTLDPDTLTVVSHVAYQLMALGVILFLLHTVQGLRPLQLGVVGLQAALGLVLATHVAPFEHPPLAWAAVNVVCASVLLLTLVRAVLVRRAGASGWMVLMAALASLNVMLGDFDDAAIEGGTPGAGLQVVAYRKRLRGVALVEHYQRDLALVVMLQDAIERRAVAFQFQVDLQPSLQCG